MQRVHHDYERGLVSTQRFRDALDTTRPVLEAIDRMLHRLREQREYLQRQTEAPWMAPGGQAA